MSSSRLAPASPAKGSGRDRGSRAALAEATGVAGLITGAVPDSVAHTAISLLTPPEKGSYAQRAHNATVASSAVRGSSRERAVHTAGVGRGSKHGGACASTSTATVAAIAAAPTPQTSAQSDMVRRSHWEEFVVHRHETRQQLQTLSEAKEQQRLSDARAHMEVEQLNRAIGICTQDINTLRQEDDESQGRLTKLERAFECDHESVDALRRGLRCLEGIMHEQVAKQDQQQEALITAMRRGDRGIADELLIKMAELNEKLGANMQALDDELAADLQGMAERMDRSLAATQPASVDLAAAIASARQSAATAADAVMRVSVAELSLDDTRACIENFMSAAKVDMQTVATSQVRELEERLSTSLAVGGAAQDLRVEMQQGLCEMQTLHEELSVKLTGEAAMCKACAASIAQETRSACERLRDGLDDVRLTCTSTETAFATMARSMQEELQSRLDESRSAREDLAAAVDEGMRDMRAEIQLKLQGVSIAPETASLISQTVESALVPALAETQEAHKGLAILVEGAVRDVNSMRGEVASAMDESRSACVGLAAATDKAVCGVRAELDAQFEKMQSANEKLPTMLEKALIAIRSELCSGLGDESLAGQNILDAARNMVCHLRSELSDMNATCHETMAQRVVHVDETIQDISVKLQAGFSAERQEREDLAKALGSSVQAVEQSLDEAVLKMRHQLQEGLDGVRVDCKRMQGEMEPTMCTASQECKIGVPPIEMVADLNKQAGKLEELECKCESNRKEAQEEVEAMRQRVNRFCEEIVEMVADLNHQACGGCVEVQQALEVAVARLASHSEEAQLRLKALETQAALNVPSASDSPRARDDLVEPQPCVETPELTNKAGHENHQEETIRRLDALDARVEALGGAMHQDAGRFEALLDARSSELAALPLALGENRGQLHALEEQLHADCSSMRRSGAKAERDLGDYGVRLETVAGTVGKMRAQMDMMEARLEGACKAAHNASTSSSPIRLDRRLESSLVTSPTTPATWSDAQGQLARLEERLETTEDDVRRQVAHLDNRLETVAADAAAWPRTAAHMQSQLSAVQEKLEEVCQASHDQQLLAHGEASKIATSSRPDETVLHLHSPCGASFTEFEKLPESLSQVPGNIAALQEQLLEVRQTASSLASNLASKLVQVDRKVSVQADDIAGMRRTMVEITNDVFKAQGGADAAYAEATREKGWTLAVEASAEDIRREWKAELERTCITWKAILIDMVQSDCKTVAEAWEDKTTSTMKSLSADLRDQCRGWVDEAASKLGGIDHVASVAPSEQFDGDVQRKCQDLVQQELSEIAHSQARQQELLRGEIERVQGETQAEAERIWEAIGEQVGGTTERSEELALETQRQCRTWVDGALRKLEDLAIRTKERMTTLATAADKREERLEARLEAALQQRVEAPAQAAPQPELAEPPVETRAARLAAAAERRGARLSANLRQSQQGDSTSPCSPHSATSAAESPTVPRSGRKHGSPQCDS